MRDRPIPVQPNDHVLGRLLNRLADSHTGITGIPPIFVNDHSFGIQIGIEQAMPFIWKNTYNTDAPMTCPAYGCVKITGVDADDPAMFTGTKPNEDYGTCYAINGDSDVEYNTTGTCYLFGLVKAKYTGTGTFGHSYGPTKDSWDLTEYNPGFFSYGVYSATDNLIHAAFTYPQSLILKTDEELASGASATCSIWADIDHDTELNVEVFEWSMLAGDTIAVGKRIIAVWNGNQWIATQAECNAVEA